VKVFLFYDSTKWGILGYAHRVEWEIPLSLIAKCPEKQYFRFVLAVFVKKEINVMPYKIKSSQILNINTPKDGY